MVATEAVATVVVGGSEAEAAPNVGGFVATACIIFLYLLLALTWRIGAIGDVLFGAALAGLVFRTPHTVAIWAGLTVLVATALALAVNSAVVAESLANYAYYGLAVGCLWAIWNGAAERFRWNMPATVLHEYLSRRHVYRAIPAPLLAATLVLAGAAILVADVARPAGSLLAGAIVFTGLRRPRFTFVLCAGATLIVLSNLLVFAHLRSPAISAGLLAGGAFLVALIQLGWRRIRRQFSRRVERQALVATGGAERSVGTPHPVQGSDRMPADV